MRAPGLTALFLLMLAAAGAEPPGAPAPAVLDAFGRDVSARGVTLVDWEGEIANPVARLAVLPPADAAFPVKATLKADPRLYFDLPCRVGAEGSAREVSIRSKDDRPAFLLAVWPDRDGEDDSHALDVSFRDAKGKVSTRMVPVRVLDQDRPAGPTFPIRVDYSQDKTGFFRDESARKVVEQAAADWAFFLDDLGADEAPAGAEETWIWSPEGFKKGGVVKNEAAYKGYLLYAYGVHTRDLRSGGEPSREGKPQTAGGKVLPFKRSGGLEIETAGNFNSIGWMKSLDPADWWKATNLKEVPNDLYSIAHHEMGHAFFFNPNNKAFGDFKGKGRIAEPRVRAYQGEDPKIDRHDHLNGSIDRASRKGAYGYEYFGDVPRCRWIITKLDLLAVQAMGYRLRDTSAFRPLAIGNAALPAGRAGEPYRARIEASGGIPAYFFEVVAGALPAGLSLDSFTGEISGRPERAGAAGFTVRVRDGGEGAKGVEAAFRIEASGK